MDILFEIKGIVTSFQGSNFDVGLRDLWTLWKKIPEPRINVPNAYLVIEYGVAFSLKVGDLNGAQKWAALAPDFAKVRQDMGEVEFLMGKVAFERGAHEIAREKFLVADAKSEGRAFEGADKKYRKLIL